MVRKNQPISGQSPKNQTTKENKYNDKNLIHLPRQHLPQYNGRDGLQTPCKTSRPQIRVLHRLCRNQYRGTG